MANNISNTFAASVNIAIEISNEEQEKYIVIVEIFN